MTRFILLMIVLGFCHIVSAAGKPDLDSLYHQLDKAIEQLDDRLAERQEQINTLKAQYAKAREPMRRYLLAEDLFEAYRKLMNDSALVYGNLCIKIADDMGRAELKAESYIRLAHQYGESGAYGEAQKYFQLVDTKLLNTDAEKTAYYEGLNHLYGEIATYSSDREYKYQAYKLSDAYRDSIMNLADTTSILWLSKKVSLLYTHDQFEEAKHYSDIWMTKVEPITPDYAYMAYIRSEIYGRLGNKDMERYWLASSAIS
ncbi:MAG: transcriptional regulator, partial [Prevotella sp.]|nr:transcriptional regulator [Prevotella sp.]